MISFTTSSLTLISFAVFILGVLLGSYLTLYKVKGKENDSLFVILVDFFFGWLK